MPNHNRQLSGFTIVELLIVVVVIAILAAVVVVAYNGVSQRATQSTLNSSLMNARKKLSVYHVDNSAYPLTNNFAAAGIKGSGVVYEYTSDGATYCLTASKNGSSYNATDTSMPAAGVCAGHASGGILTNLSTNPRMVSMAGWENNNGAIWTTTKSVTISGHPNGFTRALRANVINASANSACLSLYNVDTLGNTTQTRTLGVWVMAAASGYQARVGNSGAFTPLTANQWTYIQSPGGFSGWGSAYVQKISGTADPADLCYATGAMVVTGSTNYPYADGHSAGWQWNGATDTSTSTGSL